MTDKVEYLAEAKARLAIVEVSKCRAGSAAEKVAALYAEIAAARATGKTWRQIANDISDGEPLNADAVRIAYYRCQPQGSKSPTKLVNVKAKVKTDAVPNKAATKSAPPSKSAIVDMFGPMFDARDTHGRASDQNSEQGTPL